MITSWSFQATSSPPQLKFKVARLVGGNTFTIVGESGVETPAPSTRSTFPARISVLPGDVVGFYTVTAGPCSVVDGAYDLHFSNGDFAPGTTQSYSAPIGVRLDVSATLEPDADNDGFGDESQDCAPADASKNIDCTPPDVTITKRPKDRTKKKNATFEFSGVDARAVAGFECSLDDAPFAACASPQTVKVKKGKHVFSVRAIDAAGNVDGSPASDAWKVKKKKKR